MAKTAAVVPIRLADPIAELLAKREQLQAEHLRLGAAGRAQADAVAALAALDGEQALLEEAERSAWAQWAQWAQRGQGEPPKPLLKERERLAAKPVSAASDLAAARNGASAVEPRMAELNVELALVTDRILALKIRRALTRIVDLHADFIENAAIVRRQMMELNGFNIVLLELLGSPFRARPEIAAALQDAQVEFNSLRQAALGPDLEALAKFTAAWRRELAS